MVITFFSKILIANFVISVISSISILVEGKVAKSEKELATLLIVSICSINAFENISTFFLFLLSFELNSF